MGIQQYYYTSYRDPETENAGFQRKAMSSDISSSQEKAIQRLLSYRIPPLLDVHDLAHHPIALRYSIVSQQESVFLCSQSCGNDDRGRPGNFFSHALMMNPQAFYEVPPIFYWKSSFWCKEDGRPFPQARTLSELLPSALTPSLLLKDIWDFLAQDKRRGILHQLLCAVLHAHKMQRRIIISDSIEHTVLWIAAVSLLLPPAYRPLLSFATYHHDPYQGQFLITGILPDGSLRGSSLDQQAYFFLNAAQYQTSFVEGSAYADAVIETVGSDLDEERLHKLFARITQRMPDPTVIDEQLDALVLYAALPVLPLHTTVHQLQSLWSLVSTIHDAQREALFATSFMMVGKLWCEGKYEEGNDLLSTLWVAIGERPEDVLRSTAHTLCVAVPKSLQQWRYYSDKLLLMLIQPATTQQALDLFDFWFSVPPDLFQYSYTLPAIFLAFSQTFDEARKVQKKALRDCQTLLIGRSWYAALQPFFTASRPLFSEARRSLATLFQPRKGFSESNEMRQLFTSETGLQAHRQLVQQANIMQASFWEEYWRLFTEVLNGSDSAFILQLFSFWCEEAFALSGNGSLLPATFFLNLSVVGRELCVKRDTPFFETALDVQALHENYRWYPLIRPFFSVEK